MTPTDELVAKIRSRGYWTVRIHPSTYDTELIGRLSALERAVSDSSVALRGWSFPHYDSGHSPVRSANYVEQPTEWQHALELWRAYKSGQFLSLVGFMEDWRDQSSFWPADAGWEPGASLGVESTIFRFVEVYEFAARWSRALGLEGRIVVELSLRGLEDRFLALSPTRLPLLPARLCTAAEWSQSESYDSSELFTETRKLAVAPAQSLFELFGWDASPEMVREIQAELRG